MDLYAYSQIDNLEKVAEANGIKVDRCRGYRLMKDEEAISDKDIEKYVRECMLGSAEDEVRTTGCFVEYSSRTTRRCRKYLICNNKEGYLNVIDVNWKNVHGKLRKRIKFAMKIAKSEALAQYKLFNKYAGRNDVLYIHAKLGSWSWSDIKWWNYESQPWYLDGCDDYDRAYCDIYAKINPVEGEMKGE